jgi:hypothetical protein
MPCGHPFGSNRFFEPDKNGGLEGQEFTTHRDWHWGGCESGNIGSSCASLWHYEITGKQEVRQTVGMDKEECL